MSTELHSMATISALIRTSEWAVDEAREIHRVAARLHATRESAHASAQTSAEQARQFTRDLLGSAAFGVDMLKMATMNQMLANGEAERSVKELGAAERNLTDARWQLMQARIAQQLYERLKERKSMLHQQEDRRRMQRELDDAGTTLKIYENFSATKSTERETADGY